MGLRIGNENVGGLKVGTELISVAKVGDEIAFRSQRIGPVGDFRVVASSSGSTVRRYDAAQSRSGSGYGSQSAAIAAANSAFNAITVPSNRDGKEFVGSIRTSAPSATVRRYDSTQTRTRGGYSSQSAAQSAGAAARSAITAPANRDGVDLVGSLSVTQTRAASRTYDSTQTRTRDGFASQSAAQSAGNAAAGAVSTPSNRDGVDVGSVSVTSYIVPGTTMRDYASPRTQTGLATINFGAPGANLAAYDIAIAAINARQGTFDGYEIISVSYSARGRNTLAQIRYRFYNNVTSLPQTLWRYSFSFRAYRNVSAQWSYSFSFRYYRDVTTTTWNYSFSYRFWYDETTTSTSYTARWAAPDGTFDRYRIERETTGGAALADVTLASSVTSYFIGTARTRVRIRAEDSGSGVVGPWSAWQS